MCRDWEEPKPEAPERALEIKENVNDIATGLEQAIAGDEVGGGDMWENDPNSVNPFEDDEDDIVGPRPPPKESALDERSYGGALMPGEGTAIASFVQKGMRIPRRGEVGLTSKQISDFESEGYVEYDFTFFDPRPPLFCDYVECTERTPLLVIFLYYNLCAYDV